MKKPIDGITCQLSPVYMRNRPRFFVSPLYEIFSPSAGWQGTIGWVLSRLISRELLKKGSINRPFLVEIDDKTTLPNSIFRSSSIFFWFFLSILFEELKTVICWQIYHYKCSKTFTRKALALIFGSVSLKLLELSLIDCYVVRRILENITGRDNFSSFADCEFM